MIEYTCGGRIPSYVYFRQVPPLIFLNIMTFDHFSIPSDRQEPLLIIDANGWILSGVLTWSSFLTVNTSGFVLIDLYNIAIGLTGNNHYNSTRVNLFSESPT